MREEFHGIDHGGGTYTYKQLYNWNSVNANVWLPSLSELVGTIGNQDSIGGCYFSAMQGMNTSGPTYYYVDAQGGTQFAYFKQFNASGGGEKIWSACKQEITWLRSSYYGYATQSWHTTNASNLNTTNPTASHAVHLFVGKGVVQIS